MIAVAVLLVAQALFLLTGVIGMVKTVGQPRDPITRQLATVASVLFIPMITLDVVATAYLLAVAL